MINQAIAQLFSYLLLQRFQLRIDEFDDFSGFYINQMIMVRFRNGFIAGATIAKIVTVQYARFFKQANRPVYGCDGNAGVYRGGTFMQGFDVRMILGIGNDTRDYTTLVSDPQPFFCT